MSGFYASAGLVTHVRFLCFSRSNCPCSVSMLQLVAYVRFLFQGTSAGLIAHVRFPCFSRSSCPCPVSMLQRNVLENRSPNADFLLVRSESGSSTKVSLKFYYAQARCFATALLPFWAPEMFKANRQTQQIRHRQMC